MPLYAITPLLFIQALCTALLISQMICGHFINAILQGFGGLTFFTIGAFSYYWLPRKPLLSHIILGGILGGLILFGWQRILIAPLLECRMVHAVFGSVRFPDRTCDFPQSCFLVLG